MIYRPCALGVDEIFPEIIIFSAALEVIITSGNISLNIARSGRSGSVNDKDNLHGIISCVGFFLALNSKDRPKESPTLESEDLC